MDLSILTPMYDEPLWMLKRNVESVKAQITTKDIEHIIVIDKPLAMNEVLNYIRQQGVRSAVHTVNSGLSAARNTGIAMATGKYIMTLDVDDVMAPDRIDRQLNFMEENNFDLSWGGFQQILGDDKRPSGPDHIPTERGYAYIDTFLRCVNCCPCGSVCFKSEVVDKIGFFDEKMHDGAEDFEYWFRIMKNGYRLGCLPEVLYYQGVHGDNQTAKLIANGGFTRAMKYIREKYPNEKWDV